MRPSSLPLPPGEGRGEGAPWPRLLAAWDGSTLNTARQQCDGRRVFVRQRAVPDAGLLARALAAGMGAGARRPRHAALVLPRPPWPQLLADVEGLRGTLGLRSLLLLEPVHDEYPLDTAARALEQHWRSQARDGACGDLIDRARSGYAQLSPTERRMADLLLADAGAVLASPTAQLARDAGISQPQVIRFCRSLGLAGVKELRLQLGICLALRAQALR